jgi:hypothetical protein
MALVVGRNEIGVKRIGHVMTIPDNDIARLMYYLAYVCCAIDYDQDGEIRRFTNYDHWARLSTEEQKLLVVLCYAHSVQMSSKAEFSFIVKNFVFTPLIPFTK